MAHSRKKARLGLFMDTMIQVAARLYAKGVNLRLACLLGKELADCLCLLWAGENLYIHGDSHRRQAKRNAQICSEFNGENISSIAMQYGLTEQRIYQIIQGNRKSKREERRSGGRKTRPRKPNLHDDLVVHIARTLCLRKIDIATAREVGHEVSAFYCQYWAGINLCFPKNYRHQYPAMALEAFTDLSQESVRLLASKHGISEDDADQIIKGIVRQLAKKEIA